MWYAAKYTARFIIHLLNQSCLIIYQEEVIEMKAELAQGACLPPGSTSPGSRRQIIQASSLRDHESIFNEHIKHSRDY